MGSFAECLLFEIGGNNQTVVNGPIAAGLECANYLQNSGYASI